MNTLLDAVKWDEKGLVCANAQDAKTLRVLMVAWMNAEALQQTANTGFAHYYSRSRQKQWMKGEESGHTQKVHELRLDCDGDAIVMLIDQKGVSIVAVSHTIQNGNDKGNYHHGCLVLQALHLLHYLR